MRSIRCGLLLALALIFHATSAWSLGLGDARVESFIGQPLEMRIDLLTAPTDDLDGVTARLASADDFALIGADRAAIGMPLNFSIQEATGSRGAHILVTSRQSMNDPVLRLVVEVTWASGRLLREYTVFLDPPTVPSRAPEPTASSSPPVTTPAPAESTEPAAAAPAPIERVAESAPPPQAPANQAAEDTSPVSSPEPQRESTPVAQETPDGGEYGPVNSGETLWRVASNYVGQSGLNMNQVMLAIQRKNPEAFLDDNINLLKRGATLDMPSAAEVEEISRQRAQELVAQQEAAFRMRGSMASSSTPLLAAETNPEAAPASIETSGSEDADSVARLEIVPASEDEALAAQPGTGAVPGGEGEEELQRDLREELARTEEELYSERQQNEYLRDRINELEVQLAESEPEGAGLVADDELANFEDRLQTERLEEASLPDSAQQAVSEAPQEPEADRNMPSVTTSSASEESPWYASTMVWVVMILIVVAAVAGWLLNRRRAVEYDLSAHTEPEAPVDGLRGEAEEILRTLDSDRANDRAAEAESDQDHVVEIAATADAQSDEADAVTFESDDDGPEWSSKQTETAAPRRAGSRANEDADATVLDENSSDPEIKLDLARAYISMGDKEAARVILDEVLSTGSPGQREEARSMMDEL